MNEQQLAELVKQGFVPLGMQWFYDDPKGGGKQIGPFHTLEEAQQHRTVNVSMAATVPKWEGLELGGKEVHFKPMVPRNELEEISTDLIENFPDLIPDKWYIQTTEGYRVGPFDTREQAKAYNDKCKPPDPRQNCQCVIDYPQYHFEDSRIPGPDTPLAEIVGTLMPEGMTPREWAFWQSNSGPLEVPPARPFGGSYPPILTCWEMSHVYSVIVSDVDKEKVLQEARKLWGTRFKYGHSGTYLNPPRWLALSISRVEAGPRQLMAAAQSALASLDGNPTSEEEREKMLDALNVKTDMKGKPIVTSDHRAVAPSNFKTLEQQPMTDHPPATLDGA